MASGFKRILRRLDSERGLQFGKPFKDLITEPSLATTEWVVRGLFKLVGLVPIAAIKDKNDSFSLVYVRPLVVVNSTRIMYQLNKDIRCWVMDKPFDERTLKKVAECLFELGGNYRSV